MHASKWIAAAAGYCFAVGILAALSVGRTVIASADGPGLWLLAPILGAGTALAWGVVTGIGLLQRRRWARISAQVLAAFTVVGGLAGLATADTGDAAARIPPAVRGIFGVALLVVFSLRNVRAAFKSRAS